MKKKKNFQTIIIKFICMYIDRYVCSMMGIHTSLNVAPSINALKHHQFLDMQNDKINISTNYYYLYIDTRYWYMVCSMMSIHTPV